MASIKQAIDKAGNVYYKVTASNGRGRRVTRSWHPEAGWSKKTIDRELNKFAASLENGLSDGEIVTRQEKIEIDRQAKIEAAKVKTLRQYVDGVYMPQKQLVFSENARCNYRTCFDKRILPQLGDQLMQEISRAMLDKFFIGLQTEGLSYGTVTKYYTILHSVFKSAYMDDIISSNPMDKVSRPSERKANNIDKKELAYTEEEVQYINSCLEKEPLKWRAFVQLLTDTGIRRGEACGLCWDCVDFENGEIIIKRNLQYTPSKGVYVDAPKNGESRTVDIGEDTIALLRDLRKEQTQKAVSKYVFTQENTFEPMHPQSPTRYFKKFGKKYGIEDFHPHKLRHSYASIAITNGADVVSVSERLGHKDSSITLRMYAHPNRESIRNAGQIARDAIKGKKIKQA